jgi:hypothetical protein
MTKINQPTANPTRKLWAVMISGALVGAVQAGLGFVMPESGVNQIIADFEPFVYGGVMVLAGYFTPDHINV